MAFVVTLFGTFGGMVAGKPIPTSRAGRIEALLAYLIVERGRPHSRVALDALFFPDLPDKVARSNLRQTLTRLRRAIHNDTAVLPPLLITSDTIQFNVESEYEVDAVTFTYLLQGCVRHQGQREVSCTDCIVQLETAVSLYRGPLLEGIALADSEPFEQWLTTTRQRLQQQVIDAMVTIAAHYQARGVYEQATLFVQQLLTLEPWREAAHRQLMQLYVWQGQRGVALKQYQRCHHILMAELGVEPEAATQALLRQIEQTPTERPYQLPAVDKRPFVGRHTLLGDLHAALCDSQQQAIVLVGTGGAGKTRLALAVGWRVAKQHWGPFAAGVFFIPVPVTQQKIEASYLTTMIADVLALPSMHNTSLAAQLKQHLTSMGLLLIIDNGECLGEEALALVHELLRDVSGLTCLITSRERLLIRDAWHINVEGLPYPSPRATQLGLESHYGEEDVTNYEAVQLFTTRAQQAQGDFSLDDVATKTAVVRITQLVQGSPLALELAAAWVYAFPCTQIAAEIAARLDILQSDLPDYPDRHRSMRAVFDYSWQMLSAAAQQQLGALAVFNGRFDSDAAIKVTETSLTDLAHLVRRSLIQQHTTTPHYEMHPLLRQFTSEIAPLAESVYQKHADFYAQLLASQKELFATMALAQGLQTIQRHIDNVRAAWLWAIEHADVSRLSQYLEVLYDFYALRGWRYEGREMLQKVMPLKESALREQHPLFFTQLLTRLAEFYDSLGELQQAETLLVESRAIGNLVEDSSELSFVYRKLGLVAHRRGQYAEADNYLRFSLQVAQEVSTSTTHHATIQEKGNPNDIAHILMSLGAVAHARGHLTEGRTYLMRSAAICETAQLPWLAGHCRRLLGRVLEELEEPQSAQHQYELALAASEQATDEIGIALAMNELGRVAQLAGTYKEATDYFETAYERLHTLADKRGIMRVLINWGDLMVKQAAYDEGAKHYQSALEMGVAMEDLPFVLQLLVQVAALGLRAEGDQTAVLAAHTLLHIVNQHPLCPPLLKTTIEPMMLAGTKHTLTRQTAQPLSYSLQQAQHILHYFVSPV